MSIKSRLMKMKWFPSRVINEVFFGVRRVKHGKKLTTYGTIFVRGSGSIKIGKSVVITSCREANPIGGDIKTILYAKNQGMITIGDCVRMSNVSIVSEESVIIEKDVYIGGNCKIYDNDFHPLSYEQRINEPNKNVVSKPIVIKQGAFIGAHSIILKGVTVGERSIIGAGSVVTKSIPPDEVWAGNPAHFVKKLVS